MADHRYDRADALLRRAARYQPLRSEAVCTLAEMFIRQHRANDALYAINTLLLERDDSGMERTDRMRLIRGVAGLMLERAAAARRELAGISRATATVDDRLAAAQACVMAGDSAGAISVLDTLAEETPAVAARAALARAALYYRLSAYEKCAESLPRAADCTADDARTLQRVRQLLAGKLRRARQSTPH